GRAAVLWASRWTMALFAVFSVGIVAAGIIYQRLRAGVTVSEFPIVCQEAIWDFGTISQVSPQQLTHRFKLENLSDKTVGIEKVASDCGCIVAGDHPSEIGPASAAEFSVIYSPAPAPGPVDKRVHLIFGTSPVAKLTLVIH